jgi:hypothetical protein
LISAKRVVMSFLVVSSWLSSVGGMIDWCCVFDVCIMCVFVCMWEIDEGGLLRIAKDG